MVYKTYYISWSVTFYLAKTENRSNTSLNDLSKGINFDKKNIYFLKKKINHNPANQSGFGIKMISVTAYVCVYLGTKSQVS